MSAESRSRYSRAEMELRALKRKWGLSCEESAASWARERLDSSCAAQTYSKLRDREVRAATTAKNISQKRV